MIKKLFIPLITLIFVVQTNFSFSQNPLIGAWDVSCIVEHTDKNSLRFCDFCNAKLSDDKSQIAFNKFKLIVTEDELTIKMDKSTDCIQYSYNDEKETIKFTYAGVDYSFTILSVMSGPERKYILRDKDGSQVFLEKTKE